MTAAFSLLFKLAKLNLLFRGYHRAHNLGPGRAGTHTVSQFFPNMSQWFKLWKNTTFSFSFFKMISMRHWNISSSARSPSSCRLSESDISHIAFFWWVESYGFHSIFHFKYFPYSSHSLKLFKNTHGLLCSILPFQHFFQLFRRSSSFFGMGDPRLHDSSHWPCNCVMWHVEWGTHCNIVKLTRIALPDNYVLCSKNIISQLFNAWFKIIQPVISTCHSFLCPLYLFPAALLLPVNPLNRQCYMRQS